MSLIKDPNEYQSLTFTLRRDGSTHLDGPLDNPIVMWGLLGALFECWMATRMARVVSMPDLLEKSGLVRPPSNGNQHSD